MDEEQAFEEEKDFWEYPENTAESLTTRKGCKQ